MKTRSTLAAAFTAAVATALLPSAAQADPVVRQATGADVAAIKPAVDQFRADLGGGTQAGQNGSFGGIRREINWDGVPDALTGESLFPAGFFNSNSPRGAVFATPGTAFLVSADDDDPPDAESDEVRFSNLEPSYATAFATFSPERLFAPVGSPVTDTLFFLPGTDTQATTRGFGVVFTDVDTAGSARLQLIGQNGENLGEFPAPPTAGDGSLSFVGVSYDGGERIARARIISGAAGISTAAPAKDVTQGGPADLVVMDDFIYGEPVALSAPTPDTERPEVELEVRERVSLAKLRRGLRLNVITNEDSTLDVSLVAKPNRLLVEKSLGFGSGERSVNLKPARKLLRGARRFKAVLRVIAIDRAGNRTRVTRTIRVR
jgi:hypothetical protein